MEAKIIAKRGVFMEKWERGCLVLPRDGLSEEVELSREKGEREEGGRIIKAGAGEKLKKREGEKKEKEVLEGKQEEKKERVDFRLRNP